jgi:hypothetical protein
MIVGLIEEGRMSAAGSDLTFSSCSDRSQGEVAVDYVCCVSRQGCLLCRYPREKCHSGQRVVMQFILQHSERRFIQHSERSFILGEHQTGEVQLIVCVTRAPIQSHLSGSLPHCGCGSHKGVTLHHNPLCHGLVHNTFDT